MPGGVWCRQTSPVLPLSWTTTKVPTPTDTLALARFLYPEEQVADLVDYFGVSARLATRKALIGGEHEIRCIFEVENGLHVIKAVGWNTCELTVFDGSAPLPAPFAIDFDAEYSVYTFG